MNRLEHDAIDGGDRREALLETLLAVQRTFVSQRRRRRRIATTIAVALMAISAAIAFPLLWRAPTESESLSHSLRVERSTPESHSTPPVPEHPKPTDEAATGFALVERVGGGTREWIILEPTDPGIIERLSVTAEIDRPSIVIASARAPTTLLVDDDALARHLVAAGRRDGLIRIDGRVLLVTAEHPAANGG